MLRQAAIRQFARHGFAGVSAEAIADAAGFSGGAFYSNYRSKQEILVDVMRELQATETEVWRRVIAEGVTLDTVLDELSKRAEYFARDNEWLLVQIELQLRAARDDGFRDEYLSCRAELCSLAASVLSDLFAKSGKPIPIALDVLVDAWLAFSIGIGLYFITEPSPERREAFRAVVFAPFLRRLLDAD